MVSERILLVPSSLLRIQLQLGHFIGQGCRPACVVILILRHLLFARSDTSQENVRAATQGVAARSLNNTR